MLVIGLTGGICCGKTTVSKLFSQLGITIIDADEISRKLLSGSLFSNPSPALLKISDLFGNDLFGSLFDKNGFLIRVKLKEIIFSSTDASYYKKQLEDIMHPLVYDEINQSIQSYKQLAAQKKLSSAYLIISIPLLIETADLKIFDRILVININDKIQIERCSKRDNTSIDSIKQIIDTQIPRDKRLSYANDIIDNNQSINCLNNDINKLHNFYLQLAKQC